jgi:hypothetical protein
MLHCLAGNKGEQAWEIKTTNNENLEDVQR